VKSELADRFDSFGEVKMELFGVSPLTFTAPTFWMHRSGAAQHGHFTARHGRRKIPGSFRSEVRLIDCHKRGADAAETDPSWRLGCDRNRRYPVRRDLATRYDFETTRGRT
jgi:hypothetical protein